MKGHDLCKKCKYGQNPEDCKATEKDYKDVIGHGVVRCDKFESSK